MSRIVETVEDFDASLPSIIDPDPGIARRALDSVMEYAYRLRCYREAQHADGYRAIAMGCDDGRATEALMQVRGATSHYLQGAIAMEVEALYPGDRTFPGRWTFPGANPTWRQFDDVDFKPGWRIPDEVKAAYEDHLSGVIVGYTFDAARRFLVEDTHLGPLT